MSPLRVGVLSAEHVHADHYLALLAGWDGVELVGLSEPDAALGARVAAATGARRYAEHAALLGEGLDAVVVCSPNAGRRELVEAAAAAGSHVLCEKPIETDWADTVAMRDACEAAGVRFMTAFPMRFAAPVRALRAAVERGDLGRIYAANGVNHSEDPRHHRAWFADPERAGGGAAMDHVVHLADLLRWLLGAEPVEVWAELGDPFRRGAVETAGLVSVAFEGGAFAAIDCSWSRPASYPRWGHLRLELFGERGALDLDAFAQHLRAWGPELPRTPTWLPWGDDPDRAMLAAFLACAREDREPPVTWTDGAQALRVVLAAYEAAETGAPVRLAPLEAVT